MRRIVVVGGGIAGVEAALTLDRGLPGDQVTLVGHGTALQVSPDLVYVPVGVSERRLDVPIRELLASSGVRVVLGTVDSVDLDAGTARVDTGDLPFDVLVAAPGATAMPLLGSTLGMGTLAEAVAVRDRLDACFGAATSEGARGSVVIRAAADDAWSPPAYELSLLIAQRRRTLGLERSVSITLVTAEMEPFAWFEPGVADEVVGALAELGVELAASVPEARFDEIAGDVVIEFGPLAARHLPGLPGRDERGWYRVDSDGRVHERAFVVGDATFHGFKAAFAAAWQARRMLLALGGSLERLGASCGGVPSGAVEHHIELLDRALAVRIPVAASLADPWLGHAAEVTVVDRAPDHLAGLLVGESIEAIGGRSAASAHRALVSRSGSPRPPAAQLRHASFPSP